MQTKQPTKKDSKKNGLITPGIPVAIDLMAAYPELCKETSLEDRGTDGEECCFWRVKKGFLGKERHELSFEAFHGTGTVTEKSIKGSAFQGRNLLTLINDTDLNIHPVTSDMTSTQGVSGRLTEKKRFGGYACMTLKKVTSPMTGNRSCI